jgi:hypothetical protein
MKEQIDDPKNRAGVRRYRKKYMNRLERRLSKKHLEDAPKKHRYKGWTY